MYDREHPTIGLVLTMDGAQDTDVVAHHPGTEQAVVGVRIGTALIYLHDHRSAATFAEVWRQHTRDATRLPRGPERRPAQRVRGEVKTAVVIDVKGTPSGGGRLVRPRGQGSHLRIQLGRVVFDVRDLHAFVSTKNAFLEAATLAASVLPGDPVPPSRSQDAFLRAAAAIPSIAGLPDGGGWVLRTARPSSSYPRSAATRRQTRPGQERGR